MNFLQSINDWNRISIHEIANDIVRQRSGLQTSSSVKATPRKVLICRPNHRLGNLLLLTPLLQEVSEMFPNCKIDLFVKGNLAPILFKNYNNVNCIIQLPKRPFLHLLKYIKGWILIKKNKYDIVINVDKSSTSGRMSAQFANSRFKIHGNVIDDLKAKYPDYEHHAKFPVYNLRKQLKKMGLYQKDKLIPAVNLRLDASEIAEGKNILRHLIQNDNITICLFTYATGKKCYSEKWWLNFYERLGTEYPHVNIIEILPIQNVSKLSSRVPTFYSNDLRQIGSVIANTALFVGADSGIMHLASSVQTPTVGLFSVTNQTRYAPYYNNSVAIDTNFSNTDECMQVISSVLKARRAFGIVREKMFVMK